MNLSRNEKIKLLFIYLFPECLVDVSIMSLEDVCVNSGSKGVSIVECIDTMLLVLIL